MDQHVADDMNAVQEEPDKTLNYLNLDIKIGYSINDYYPIVAVNQSGNDAHITMHLSSDNAEMRDYLNDLCFALLYRSNKPQRKLSRREQKIQDFGQRLFDVLIAGEVRNLYDAIRIQAKSQLNSHLRIRLCIEPRELASLPWEFLYDSRESAYVGLTDNTSIIRYVEPLERPQSLIQGLPLYILGICANPGDLDPFDSEHEKGLVEDALKDLKKKGLVKMTWLDEIIRPEKQTWDELQQILLEDSWNIFHFIGYGRFYPGNGEGQVALPSDKVQAYWLDAQVMAQPLVKNQSLQLIVLNSSEGAFGNDSNERDIFFSSANTLVNNGIPSVLSLQFKIADQAKYTFFHTFYKALANGMSIDEAVLEARKTINSGTSNVLEFGTPVLYTCLPDSSLFNSPRKQKQRRLSFLQLPWKRLLKTVAVLILISTFILFLLSILLNWGLIASILSALIAILSLFGIGKTIQQVFQIAINFFRQVPNHLKRLFWPAPHYSRRWFLKGVAYGSASGIILGGLATLAFLSRYSRNRSFFPLQATSTADTYSLVNTYTGHAGAVNSVSWSPDGQRIASASADNTVQVWEWNTNSVDNNPYTGHAGAVNSVSWSPDGQRIASASDDRTVQVWEASSKNFGFKYKGHTQKVTSVAWAPNGRYIASASDDGTAQVFDSTTSEHISTYKGHSGIVLAVAWSRDSKYIASGGEDGTVQAWEATTGKSIAPPNRHESKVNAVAWSPQGTLIVSASSGVRPVDIWNPITSKNYKLTLANDSVFAITWSPTGKMIALAFGLGSLQVWDPIKNISLDSLLGGSALYSVAWAPKGKHIAAGAYYNNVYIWLANE